MYEASELKISGFRSMGYLIHLFDKRQYFVHLIYLLSKCDYKYFDVMHIKLMVSHFTPPPKHTINIIDNLI